MDNKIFSIVIPVYNGEKTIQRTLASLISSKDYIKEIIIVDDHSADTTIQKAHVFDKLLPITILKSDGFHNPGLARKTGLLYARGEWITFVDADDCLTPSSLRYVIQQLEDSTILLHTQSIYYESGNFDVEDIGHSDLSCGGNFYRRDYLIKNQLYPHDVLCLSEDEYFNNLITMFIKYVDKGEEDKIAYYDYPVYEVHHDLEDGASLAISNWTDYAIKYHLRCQMYLVTDMLKRYEDNTELYNALKEDYISNFIFVYFIYQTLNEFNQKQYFRKALRLFIRKFHSNKEELINWYDKNTESVDSIREGAMGSMGEEVNITEDFSSFVNSL